MERFLDGSRFDITELYVERWDREPGLTERIPSPALVINGVADPDRHPVMLDGLEERLRIFGAPVLNRPSAVQRTSRDAVAHQLDSYEGLFVPAVRRLEIGREGFDVGALREGYPWILRRVGTHRGGSLERVDTAAEAHRWFAEHLPEGGAAYAVQFVGNPFREGLWRRFRLLHVGGSLIPITLHFHDHWNVHSSDRGPLMLGDPSLVALESAFIEEPQSVIGESAFAVIDKALESMQLDYVGMDFDLLPDGRVLVFEVNAAMAPQHSLAVRSPYLNKSLDRVSAALEGPIARRLNDTQLTPP